MTEWQHHTVHTNGVRLHYVEAGSGPLVLLLHGFPEFWYGWRQQIPALAAAGFRVVAPDMRGYNQSSKPSGIANYRMERLVEDVVGLTHHLGEERAHVVGHDWGGMVAWYTAMLHPEIVSRLAILNAPHPVAYSRELFRTTQAFRSLYVLFFQLPWLPERVIRARNYALLRRALPFPREELDRYVEAVRQPGALPAMLHYYRALLRYPRPRVRRILAPTLLIWGERDPALVPQLAAGLERGVPNLRVERIPEATHWVQHEVPDRVNELLAGFLA